jgi:hypothetical protein
VSPGELPMIQALVLCGFVIANAGGAFVGLLINSYMGDYDFTNLKSDIAKCLTLATVFVVGTCILVCWLADPRAIVPVMLVIPVLWYWAAKTLWSDLEKAGIVIVGSASFFAMIVVAVVVAFVLQLSG